MINLLIGATVAIPALIIGLLVWLDHQQRRRERHDASVRRISEP